MFDLKRFFIWVFLFFFSILIFSSGQNIQKKSDQEKLSKILIKAAEYFERLQSQSVHFFCREKIVETIYPIPKKFRAFIKSNIGVQGDFTKFRGEEPIVNSYLYDFQVIRKGKREKEKRILLEENGKKRYKEKVPLKTKIFIYRAVVYGPEIFGKKSQRFYNFSITGSKRWKGMDVLMIKAAPKNSARKDLAWGEFMIEKKDSSFIKINIDQKSVGNFYSLWKKARVMNARARLSILLEYNVKNNGIRFPSRFILKEIYITTEGEKIMLSKIEVNYSDYNFFNVDVKVQKKESIVEDKNI
ncbi:MAG: hypothetical protein ABFR75_12750 [Acidobacteriota bacterium]